MQNYIGKIVQLIYIDSKKKVSIRNAKVLVIGEDKFMAYCYQANEVRSFKRAGVVDVEILSPRILEVIKNAQRYSEKSKANTI